MKILITGATGFIGSHMAEHAVRQGHDTWAAIRPTSNRSNLQAPNLRHIVLNLDDAELLATQLEAHRARHGTWDVVIHCAGTTKCRHAHEFDQINYGATRHLVDTLMRLDMMPQQFIFISTLGIYGPLHEQEPYSSFAETDTPRPNTLYGKSKYKAEEYIKGIATLPYVIFRPTGVYGPRDRDYLLLVRSIRAHIDLSLGYRPQRVTFLYVKDLVESVFIAMRKGVQRRSYLITDGNTYSSSDFTHAVRAALGNPFTFRLTIPLWLGRVAARIADMGGRLLGRTFTFNSDKFRILAQRNWQCDITPLTEELGYHPRYDLEAGIAETLAKQSLYLAQELSQ